MYDVRENCGKYWLDKIYKCSYDKFMKNLGIKSDLTKILRKETSQEKVTKKLRKTDAYRQLKAYTKRHK